MLAYLMPGGIALLACQPASDLDLARQPGTQERSDRSLSQRLGAVAGQRYNSIITASRLGKSTRDTPSPSEGLQCETLAVGIFMSMRIPSKDR